MWSNTCFWALIRIHEESGNELWARESGMIYNNQQLIVHNKFRDPSRGKRFDCIHDGQQFGRKVSDKDILVNQLFVVNGIISETKEELFQFWNRNMKGEDLKNLMRTQSERY